MVLFFVFFCGIFFLVGFLLCCCVLDKVDCCYLVLDVKFYDVVLVIGLFLLLYYSIICSYFVYVFYILIWW